MFWVNVSNVSFEKNSAQIVAHPALRRLLGLILLARIPASERHRLRHPSGSPLLSELLDVFQNMIATGCIRFDRQILGCPNKGSFRSLCPLIKYD